MHLQDSDVTRRYVNVRCITCRPIIALLFSHTFSWEKKNTFKGRVYVTQYFIQYVVNNYVNYVSCIFHIDRFVDLIIRRLITG